MAVSREPGPTCVHLRVRISGRLVSEPPGLYDKRKIPLDGWWFG